MQSHKHGKYNSARNSFCYAPSAQTVVLREEEAGALAHPQRAHLSSRILRNLELRKCSPAIRTKGRVEKKGPRFCGSAVKEASIRSSGRGGNSALGRAGPDIENH